MAEQTKWLAGARRRTFIIVVVVVAVIAGLVAAGEQFTESKWYSKDFHGSIQTRLEHQGELDEQELNKFWAEKVVSGGYILHFRHAQREKWHDSAAFDAYELATGTDASKSSFARATCLTERGIEEAKLIGNIFRMLNVNISKVISSPSCRAWQTALYAFGGDYEIENALLNRTAIVPEQRDEFAARLREVLMDVKIESEGNVILTGHGATLEWDGKRVIDSNETDRRRDRRETGFFVIERVDGKLVMRHKFTSIKDFATVMIKLPVIGENQASE